jgi:hypothetical protein
MLSISVLATHYSHASPLPDVTDGRVHSVEVRLDMKLMQFATRVNNVETTTAITTGLWRQDSDELSTIDIVIGATQVHTVCFSMCAGGERSLIGCVSLPHILVDNDVLATDHAVHSTRSLTTAVGFDFMNLSDQTTADECPNKCDYMQCATDGVCVNYYTYAICNCVDGNGEGEQCMAGKGA